MRITNVETLLLTVPTRYTWGIRPHNFAIIRVMTDSGLVGLGETLLAYYVPELVPAQVNHFRDVVLGENPFEINRLWRKMFVKAMRWGYKGPAISVLGAIEIALWDILGKALEMPIYELLGGLAHDRLRCYASTGNPGFPLENTLARFRDLADAGFTALKTMHGYAGQPLPVGVASLVRQEREKVEAMRRALGDDVDLMMDPAMPFNRAPWSGDVALQVVKALDDYHLLWMEQPVPQTNVDDYVRIRRLTKTPLAAGENATTLHDLKPFFEKRAIDIVQPDSTWCGGIGECMKIVAAAEAHSMRVAPHCYSGAVGLAANYHVAFASRACFIVEFPTSPNPLINELTESLFKFRDGYLYPPAAPGLGIELNERLIEDYPFVAGSGLSHGRSPFPRPIPARWQSKSQDAISW